MEGWNESADDDGGNSDEDDEDLEIIVALEDDDFLLEVVQTGKCEKSMDPETEGQTQENDTDSGSSYDYGSCDSIRS